jgi:hypothetical protein
MNKSALFLSACLSIIVVASSLHYSGFFTEKRDPLEDFEYFVTQIETDYSRQLGIREVKYDVSKTDSLSTPFVASLSFERLLIHKTTINNLPYSFSVEMSYKVNFSWQNNRWEFNGGMVIENNTNNEGTTKTEVEKIKEYEDLPFKIKMAYYNLMKYQGDDPTTLTHPLTHPLK